MQTAEKTMNSSDKRYYRIRKEVVWLTTTVLAFWFIRNFYDYWSHLNWPPFQGSNKAFIKSLGCDMQKYSVTEEMVRGDTSGKSNIFSGFDRIMFFQHPECAAFPYLNAEGSGIRLRYSIFDMTKKKPTAHIEILFVKND